MPIHLKRLLPLSISLSTFAGTSLDLSILKKVKTEPEDPEIIQITVQGKKKMLGSLDMN